MSEWLSEQLKTIRNLVEISLLLIEQNREDLSPTALEILHLESQKIVDENCGKGTPQRPRKFIKLPTLCQIKGIYWLTGIAEFAIM